MPIPAMTELDWRRVSPRYMVVEAVGALLWMLFFAGLTVFLIVVVEAPLLGWIWPACCAALAFVSIFMSYFRARAIRYALREDDLIVRRGVWFEHTVAVPYGRMQLVDVRRGPIMRLCGLSSVKMITAAATTKAELPGLPVAEAESMRDHLVRVAETRRAGL